VTSPTNTLVSNVPRAGRHSKPSPGLILVWCKRPPESRLRGPFGGHPDPEATESGNPWATLCIIFISSVLQGKFVPTVCSRSPADDNIHSNVAISQHGSATLSGLESPKFVLQKGSTTAAATKK
jgi:hypothetical protein